MARRSLSQRVQELEEMVELLHSQIAMLQASQPIGFWERQLQPVERKETRPKFTCGVDIDPKIMNPDAIMCERQVEPCPRRPRRAINSKDLFSGEPLPPEFFRQTGLM